MRVRPEQYHDPVFGWTPTRLGDLTGTVHLVSGATSGIGLRVCAILRWAGADVIVAGRSPERRHEAVVQLQRIEAPGAVHSVPLDLAQLHSVRQSAEAVRELTEGLDSVVNNAGVLQLRRSHTSDGFESHLGINHLGHFLWNGLLFDLVTARAGRVVSVSSVTHARCAQFDLADPMLEQRYRFGRAYAQSKLANLLYSQELSRRLTRSGSAVRSVAAHPGYASTNLVAKGSRGPLRQLVSMQPFAQSPAQGAVPVVLAAAGDPVRNGGYYGPTGPGGLGGAVGQAPLSHAAQDEAIAVALWSLSERLVGHDWLHVGWAPAT